MSAYHRSIGKKPVDADQLLLLLNTLNQIIKLLNLKLLVESG